MGNNQPKTDSRPTRRKLTPDEEAQMIDLAAKGIRKEVLAVQFGVHFNTVGNVLRRNEEGQQPRDRSCP